MSQLESLMVNKLAPLIANSINIADLKGSEDFLIEIIKKSSPTLTIKLDSNPSVHIHQAHHQLPIVLKQLQTREPLFLTGPAGSGKSTIAEHAAKALGFDFASISVCAQTTKSDFLGYMDAVGNYHPTLFRKIYENGGVYLIDEIDAGNPNVLAVLNGSLSASQYAFPDKMVNKHKEFVIISTANTLGTGSTEYVGRNQLDAATLDRFNFIHIDYDKKLEKLLFDIKKYSSQFGIINKIRDIALKNDIKIIISTRSFVKIYKLLEADFSFETALKSTIFKSCDNKTYDDLMEKATTTAK